MSEGGEQSSEPTALPVVSPSAVRDFRNHARDWRGFRYVYPVVSRRSRGLSIGVNLNPDAACNFDCIYCQVDRTKAPTVRDVDLVVLETELRSMLQCATDGAIFDEAEFRATPAHLRRLNDIAFSGDGEPTTCRVFTEAVRLVAELKREFGAAQVKTVLITDACYLTRPAVVEGLAILDESNGEIWAKLDAGTEAYYSLVNRPNYPLAHVMENIVHAARVRPVVIQSLFMRVKGLAPNSEEISEFCDRLNDIRSREGTIRLVQVYTVARRPAESFVTALSTDELATISNAVVANTSLPVESFGE